MYLHKMILNRISIRTILTSLIAVAALTISAQGTRCLAHEHYSQAVVDNPELAQVRVDRKKVLNQIIRTQNNQKNRAAVTLPIVFHVIYNTSAQNIDSTQIASQIDVINADFRKLNSNIGILQGGFVNLAADSEFEFKLATTDPNGNASNGITRTVTTNPAIGGSDTDYYDPDKGGVPAWDPERYINVWVVNINSAGGDFGFATFPGEADPVTSDGCVIDYKYFGTTGTAAASQPQHLGRTLTHELGHYFGLFHIWGDVDDCSVDDDIADTPMQETSTEECLTYPFFDDCTTSGDGINFYNYMDYTDDDCMAMFTVDQKAKMQAVISMTYAAGGRSELAQFFSSQKEIPTLELEVFPNPFSGRLQLTLDTSIDTGDKVEVFDITGRQVLSTVVSGSQMDLDLASQSDGIYLVQIRTDAALWYSKVVLIKE